MPRGGRGGGRKRRGTRNTKPKRPKDPHKPKTNPSCYLLFNNEVRASFREKYPDSSPGERAKLVAAKWKEMSVEEKKPYNDKAAILRAEYMSKMAEYKNTKHYKDYQKKLTQWKQRCADQENSDSSDDDDNQSDDSQSNDNSSNHNKKRRKNWKEFKV